MIEWAIKGLMIGILAWVVWAMIQPRFAWEIRIRDGRPQLRKGKVTAAFLDQVTAICQECGVTRGWIGGRQRGRRLSLRFSKNFPPGPQQRLRNAWLAAG